MPYSIERFGTGHSLVSNKVDPRVSLPQVDAIQEGRPELDINKFGLFEVSAPDFNKYYPDVTSKDLSPADEDFVQPIFRALSKVVINKYGPIDFSIGNVLESSMPLLIGQSLYTNHEQIVGNEVGVIPEVFFQAERVQKGIKIPAGINVRAKIDGKSNPKVARSVMMDPPSIHSTSVTVAFNWEQSHPKLSLEEFYRLLGTLDASGKLVKRNVTKIIRYDELSFVSHGADPFAQRVDEKGNINNPEYANRVYKFNEGDNRAKYYHFIDFKDLGQSEASFSLGDTIPGNLIINNNKPTHKSMNEALLVFLRGFFGMDANATEAEVSARLQADLPGFKADKSTLDSVRVELSTAKTEISTLKAKYPEGSKVLTADQEVKLTQFDAQKVQLETVTKSERDRCLKLYQLSVGGADKADAAITKLIAEASWESLTGLSKQYEVQVEKDFTASCTDCGSHNVTRSSAAPKPAGDNTPKPAKTTQEVMQEFQRKANAQRIDLVHGEPVK